MPRELRSFEPGVVYHLISRFVGREFFVTKPLHRSIYVELHRKALKRTDWRLLGYAIMSNHIHLAAIAGARTLDSWLRPVHAPFAEMLNKEHGRIGPIFVRGPKDFAVVNHRVAHLLAYIHNNPVRASICAAAIDSNWTSHRAYVGQQDARPWLNVSLGLSLSGLDASGFDSWVSDPERRADRSFSEEAHELELLRAEHGDLAEAPGDQLALAIVDATSVAMRVPIERIRGRTRGQAELTARAVAVHCSGLLRVPEQRIATALNISQQRVNVLRQQEPAPDALAVALEVREVVRREWNDKL